MISSPLLHGHDPCGSHGNPHPTARIHIHTGRRSSCVAARGARTGRARTARRCAHAHELGRARVADQHRGILARIAGGGLGRRTQPADRLPLERKRPHPLEPTRDRTDFARPRCRPGWRRRDHVSAAARQQYRTNRVCADHRPGRHRRCREPVATWHQCHRLHPVRVHSEREMARVAEGKSRPA